MGDPGRGGSGVAGLRFVRGWLNPARGSATAAALARGALKIGPRYNPIMRVVYLSKGIASLQDASWGRAPDATEITDSGSRPPSAGTIDTERHLTVQRPHSTCKEARERVLLRPWVP
jgi:hypothetical protein